MYINVNVKGSHLVRLGMASLFFFILGLNYAQIITVKQDGTGDYALIQDAIDAAAEGDTVLVYSGVYYENIRFRGKNITVGSLHLTTGIPNYIQQTIIDGNQSGSCVFIDTVSQQAVLDGFTLRNGSGFYTGNSINPGGGIFITESTASIISCIIINNTAGNGGGLDISYSNVEIINSKISHNSVNQSGGGIYMILADVHLSGTTISHNHCYMRGGGILYAVQSSLTFDTVNLCNMYYNYAANGSDIYKVSANANLPVIVDTFTVTCPDAYHLYSSRYQNYPNIPNFDLSIQHGKTQAINANLYVSPNGNNENSGLTHDEPLQSIAFAMAKIVSDSTHPNTIYLADGTYSISGGEKYPLNMRSYVSITGQEANSTILDAEDLTAHAFTTYYITDFMLSNFTVTNSFGNYHGFYEYVSGLTFNYNDNINIDNVNFILNSSELTAGLSTGGSDFVNLTNLEFIENYGSKSLGVSGGAPYGTPIESTDTAYITKCRFIANQPPVLDTTQPGGRGAIASGSDNEEALRAYFVNCEFVDNYTRSSPPYYASTSLGCTESARVTAVNCTFTDNYSINPNAANIGVTSNSDMSVYNSIMYGNHPAEFYMYSDENNAWDTCKLDIYNSLVSGGEEGIRTIGSKNIIDYAPTNIDTDPMFYGEGDYPYSLDFGSPCINAGTLDLPPEIVLPEYDLAGNPRVYDDYIDMGAYEHGPWVGIGTPNVEHRMSNEEVLGARPNPFRYGTYVSYEMREAGSVNISVYDMQGKLQAVLLEGFQPVGSGEFYWDGAGIYSSDLPAGVYVLRMVVNGEEKGSCKLIMQ